LPYLLPTATQILWSGDYRIFNYALHPLTVWKWPNLVGAVALRKVGYLESLPTRGTAMMVQSGQN
jgi:hypothetical protein